MENSNKIKLAIFYSTNELDIKDADGEVFNDEREKIHFFLFHNRDLHFSKTEILKKVLMKKLELIQPEIHLKKRTLIMIKKIKNFDTREFDETVDKEYNEYLSKINYRVSCIFQTFTLFLRLYSFKNLIFVFPMQLYNNFLEIAKENNIIYTEISKINNIVRRMEALHWIQYYSRKDIGENSKNFIDYKNITKILLLQEINK